MKLEGTYEVAASKACVWNALTQSESLTRILPGCERLEAVGDNRFTATVKVKVGPIHARFQGKVQLKDLDPCTSFRLTGSGDGGASGKVTGHALIRLEAVTSVTTRITYLAETSINGKIAALGGRLVEAVSKRNIRLMMEGLEREVSVSPERETKSEAHPSPVCALPPEPPISDAELRSIRKTMSALLFQSRLNGFLLALAAAALFGIWLD